MIWGHTKIRGWFFSPEFHYYQKCSGRVVSYIEKYGYFYRVHVTFRGDLGMCDIEYRNPDFNEALAKAEELLEKYKDASKKEDLHNDFYCPYNREGFWQKHYNTKKRGIMHG